MSSSNYPKLKVISFKICPYVQRIIIALLEKGIPYEVEYIDLANKPEWFLKISPFGKVPVLIVDDKHVLFESVPILEYLEEIAPEKPLHPKDPIQKAINRAWFDYISGIYGSFIGVATATDEQSFQEKVKEIATKYEKLEPNIKGPFFNGEQFSIIDVLLAPNLRALTILENDFKVDIFGKFPKLQQYRNLILERPSVKDSLVPEYHDLYLAYIKNKGGFIASKLGV